MRFALPFLLAAALAGCGGAPEPAAPPIRDAIDQEIWDRVMGFSRVRAGVASPAFAGGDVQMEVAGQGPAWLRNNIAVLRGQSPRCIPFLVYAVESGDEKVVSTANNRRTWCLETLVAIGGPAVDPLLGVVERNASNPPVRDPVLSALGRIGSERTVPTLRKFAADGDPLVRARVVQALGRVAAGGATSEATTREIVKSLGDRLTDDGDPFVRAKAVEALAEIGSDPKRSGALLAEVLPWIQRALFEEEDAGVRVQAVASIHALGRRGLRQAEAKAILLEAKAREAARGDSSDSEAVRMAIHQALGALAEQGGR